MNPQKELQQMQDLSLKLDIPIWKNSIELPFRDKKKHHTFALAKKCDRYSFFSNSTKQLQYTNSHRRKITALQSRSNKRSSF